MLLSAKSVELFPNFVYLPYHTQYIHEFPFFGFVKVFLTRKASLFRIIRSPKHGQKFMR